MENIGLKRACHSPLFPPATAGLGVATLEISCNDHRLFATRADADPESFSMTILTCSTQHSQLAEGLAFNV